MLEHNRMKVILDDGDTFDFRRTPNGNVWVWARFRASNADESSIRAIVGEPLEVFMGTSANTYIKTDSPIKEIKYDDDCNDNMD